MPSDAKPPLSAHAEADAELLRAADAVSRGDLCLGENLCLHILNVAPDFAQALSLLAEIRWQQQRTTEALEYSTLSVTAAPKDAMVLNNRADLLNRYDRPVEALQAAEAALTLDPDLAEAHVNRGTALTSLFRFTEAKKVFEHALALKKELRAVVYGNLIILHGAEGQYQTARKFADTVVEEFPGVYALALNRHRFSMYTPSITRRVERDTTKAFWDATPAPEKEAVKKNISIDASTNRRLRVGYFSADFRNHPVSRFLKPVLQRHDSKKIHTVLYDVTPKSDDFSPVIRELADDYHCGLQQSDAELAQSIADDRIDLLVDLTGVFNNNRLNVFRYKPAPVQAMWIGYSGTSGLTEMDYVIADNFVCPNDADADFMESIVRLPDHYLCHEAADITVLPRNPFAQSTSGVTFGNFNNHMKLNSDVIRVWSEILKRVPNSKLYLKAPGFKSSELRQHVRRQFEARGVDNSRLKVSGPLSLEAHMSAYNEVDIALDPFPYCGTTTTVDALSMGIPVVTLVGERWVQRTSYSFLNGMGWESLCASTEKEYMDIAIGLAKNPSRLQALKASGREKFVGSALCDPDRFTKNLENAYRMMWQQYCESTA